MAFLKQAADELKANAMVSHLEFARQYFHPANMIRADHHFLSAQKAFIALRKAEAEYVLTVTGWDYVLTLCDQLSLLAQVAGFNQMVEDCEHISGYVATLVEHSKSLTGEPARLPTLERIVYFSRPPYPWWEDPSTLELIEAEKEGRVLLNAQQFKRFKNLFQHETYDARVITNDAVPSTRMGTLIRDLRTVATVDLKAEATTPLGFSEMDIRRTLAVYEAKPWRQLRGLRPWTHWNFVRSIPPPLLQSLSREVHLYILKHGLERNELAP